MKKALNSRLMSEVVNPEVSQGFTTDEDKAALRNINPTKAAGPDKIHSRFLHHLGLASISLLMSISNKLRVETKFPQEWRVANIRQIPKGGKDLQKMKNYIPHVDGRKHDGAPGHQPSTIFCQIDAPVNRILSTEGQLL